MDHCCSVSYIFTYLKYFVPSLLLARAFEIAAHWFATQQMKQWENYLVILLRFHMEFSLYFVNYFIAVLSKEKDFESFILKL